MMSKVKVRIQGSEKDVEERFCWIVVQNLFWVLPGKARIQNMMVTKSSVLMVIFNLTRKERGERND